MRHPWPLLLLLLAGACSSAAPAPGKACTLNSDCNNPLACSFGRCHVQCVVTTDCPAGQRCLKGAMGNVCQLPEEQKCGLNSQCPAGLACAKDLACRNECLEDRDCGSKTQKCVLPDRVCAEPSELDGTGHLTAASDGGVSPGADAGPEAGAVDAATDLSAADAPADGAPSDGSSDVASDSASDTVVAAGPPRLWVTATSEGFTNTALYGYSADQLAVDASGPAPAAQYTRVAAGLFLFVLDGFGNLWGEGGGGNLDRQPAIGGPSVLAPSVSTTLGKSTVGQIFALDPGGNLWIQNNTAIVRYDRGSLNGALPGGVTTTLSVTAVSTAIAFDADGDLLIQDIGSVQKWAKSQLVGSGSIADPAARKLTMPPSAVCRRLATDPKGNLWLVDCPGNILLRKITAAQLAGTGTADAALTNFAVDPVALAMPAQPSLVFDDAGDAWLVAGSGKIVKLAASDLAAEMPGQTVTLQPKLSIRGPAGNAVTFRALFWK
jgi:hypothetical protein